MSKLYAAVEKADRIRCRPEGEGKYLLYNPRTDQLHMLDEHGKRIFDLCDGREIDEVVRSGSEIRQPGMASVTAADVLDFLCGLKKRGLVVMR